MRQRRRLGLALSSAAAAGVACLAIATPALATDPAGNNGTVKIDTIEVDDHNDPNIANRPHVGCTFQVRFFGFDAEQTAKITFDIHQPSGTSDVPLYSKTETISTDGAGGGMNDEDEVFTYTASDWSDLTKYKEHQKQGYHVKLTIESAGVPGGVKHKVFWIQDCETPTTPTSPPGSPTTTPPTESTPPGGSLSPSAGGVGGGNGEEGGLPVTGVAATGTALTGLALIGGGVALMVLRRRRDKITFTS